jgi:hypothetical protein
MFSSTTAVSSSVSVHRLCPLGGVLARQCGIHTFHQYLAYPQLVWNAFGSWLRTIQPAIPPSELVVAIALRQSWPEFS